MNWRQLIPFLGPKWMVKDKVRNPDGTEMQTDSRVLYAVKAVFDAVDERLRLGVRARMPGLAPEDALSYIGRDRKVIRGPEETIEAYEARLIRAIDDWWIAGGPWALMEQIRGYCTPHAIRTRIYNNHGTCFTIDRDGTRTVVEGTAWNWDNGPQTKFGRFWVLIYPTTGTPKKPWDKEQWSDVAGSSSHWGTNKWDVPTKTWGTTATHNDVLAIRSIVKTWKPAGSHCVNIIIVFSDTALAPADTAPPLADGNWTNDGKYDTATPGRKVAARYTNAEYWGGTS